MSESVRPALSGIFLMQGNEACVQAALDVGLRFFAGYPITPSTEIAEGLSARLPHVGGAFIQMEDEIASMGAIIGGSLAGKKSMTATSGPGFSLMQELIGFACLCEVPCVVVNVQRGGPSTGLPTSPAQGEIMQSRWGTHGDHPIVVLSPSSVTEMYELTVKAFNIAEALRTPVILLADEVVGHMRERISFPESIEVVNRIRPTCAPETYRPYSVPPGETVPRLADFGDGYRFNVTSLIHDETGFPSGDPKVTEALLLRLMRKIEEHKKEFTFVESEELEDAEIVLFSCGSTSRSAKQAMREARAQGRKVGWIKIMTIWPFPEEVIRNLPPSVKTVLVCEMNLGQLVSAVREAAFGNSANGGPSKVQVESLAIADGRFITPSQILAKVELLGRVS